jgi:heptosyltransferase-2
MKLLIIKLGAFGDVVRTTPLLRRLHRVYRDPTIVWIVEREGMPLLRSEMVRSVVPVDEASGEWLSRNRFDWAGNFDEDRRACELLAAVHAPQKFGFVWNAELGVHWPVTEHGAYGWALSQNDDLKFRLNRRSCQDVMFEMIGERFAGEPYVLPAIGEPASECDVALNHVVGPKFGTKAWPYWNQLCGVLRSEGLRVSMQEHCRTLDDYALWIKGARIVVTTDSLGMHLAMGLGKDTLVLMGATSEREVELYGVGEIINRRLPCSPCYRNTCPLEHHACMRDISVQEVAARVLARFR